MDEISRESEEYAQEVFENLFPKKRVKRHSLEFFCRSISLANQFAPKRWGVSLLSAPTRVRLNVGRIEVLTIGEDWFHLVLDFDTLPDIDLWKYGNLNGEQNKPIYPIVPGSIGFTFTSNQALVILPIVQHSHTALLQNAARTPINGMTAKAHSPGIIVFLENYLGQSISQPEYFETRENDRRNQVVAVLPEEIVSSEQYYEGSTHQILETSYERDARARMKCIAHYGTHCSVCDMGFEDIYGSAGRGFIHIHHLTPLSEIRERYKVDPIHDLRPVCANCHSMIHMRKPPYTVDEVRTMIQKASKLKRNMRRAKERA